MHQALITEALIEELAWCVHDIYNQLEQRCMPVGMIAAYSFPLLRTDFDNYRTHHGKFVVMSFADRPAEVRFVRAHPPLPDSVTKVGFFDMANCIPPQYALFHHRELGYPSGEDFMHAITAVLDAHNAYQKKPQLQ